MFSKLRFSPKSLYYFCRRLFGTYTRVVLKVETQEKDFRSDGRRVGNVDLRLLSTNKDHNNKRV